MSFSPCSCRAILRSSTLRRTTPFRDYGYEGRRNIVATKRGAGDGRSVTLSGHVDVVLPDPVSAWDRDLRETEVEAGRMYGRGALDMKGGIVALVFAYQALDELGMELAGTSPFRRRSRRKPAASGVCCRRWNGDAAPMRLSLPNPPALPTLGVASAGVMYFRVTVRGRAAHTAHKFLGVDAVGHAFEIYDALMSLREARNELKCSNLGA